MPKHDPLTEEELSKYSVNSNIRRCLELVQKSFPDLAPSEINVLDWGCGRGRSVAKLREQGFNAFGVDIDERAIANGLNLLENRGYEAKELLRPVSQIGEFPDAYFHFIFSEQVFEHVADLTEVISEQARLTVKNGAGMHCFPSALNIWEDHLKMPLVHWLPKNPLRKVWIGTMLGFGFGPKPAWSGVKGKNFTEKVDVYYQYMNKKTFYRDNSQIQKIFSECEFESQYRVTPMLEKPWSALVPNFLKRKGFPNGPAVFQASKRG